MIEWLVCIPDSQFDFTSGMNMNGGLIPFCVKLGYLVSIICINDIYIEKDIFILRYEQL